MIIIKKKIYLLILTFLIIFLINLKYYKVNASKNEEVIINSKAVVLLEPYNKQILYAKNENQKLFPASMTKIVTLKLVLDAIENKQINWNQIVKVSKYASKMGGSQIYLAEGEEMSVEDLFKSVAIVSANDAAVTLAELVAGSEAQFVKKMNQEVKRLNLKNTNFENCTGLPVENHYTTPYDIGILGINLINQYEEIILKYTSCYEDYIRVNTPKKFWLVNTNKLIKSNPEIDGLKTGWTKEAGYCLTCTMKRNDMRLVSVVMGAESVEKRSNDTLNLLSYGFNNYKKRNLFTKNQVVKKLNNIKLNPSNQEIIIPNEINILEKINENNNYKYEIILDERRINSYQSKEIGMLIIYDDNGNIIVETLLDLKDENHKASFFNILLEIIKAIL